MRKFAYVNVTRFFLELIPTFSWSLVFGLIAMEASPVFDYNSLNWKDGHVYNVTDYYKSKS